MHPGIDAVLDRRGGVASRDRLVRAVGRSTLDHEVRSGGLARPFARVHCRPWNVDVLADRAALLSVGGPVALSHVSALARWNLVSPHDEVQVTVPARRRLARQPGLVLHRTRRFPAVVRLDGMIVTTAAASAVASWSQLAPGERRGPVIAAVRRGLASPAELREALRRQHGVVARRELTTLIGLIEAGCESELEIWSQLKVFDVPGLRHAARQRIVTISGRQFRLDLAFDVERVGVELDGHGFHSSREDRERDMRRDALLAAAGWVVLRFSYERLHNDPSGVRRDVLAVLAVRRRAA